MNHDQEQAIKTRGYQIWQESGASHGHDREDWEHAEHEIQAAELPVPAASVETSGDRHLNDVGTVLQTPAALFFPLVQGWIESGRIIASMTPWSFWSAQVR